MDVGAQGILLVSRNPGEGAEREAVDSLAAALTQRGHHLLVEATVARGTEAVVQAGIDRLVDRGARQIALLPVDLFDDLSNGEHRHLHQVVTHYPGVTCSYGRPLGLHPRLIRTVSESARHAEDGWPERGPARTAVLVVGRGSTEPIHNADLWKAARLMWEETGYSLVECAFARQTAPNPSDGVMRCLQLGARRVIIVPYMLFKGSESKELEALADEWRAMVPYAEFIVAPRAGVSAAPHLVDLFLEQAARAWEEQRLFTSVTDTYKSAAAGV